MTRIPKKLHQIWIGDKNPPEHCIAFSKQMKEMHPDWEYKLWTNEEVFKIYKDDPFLSKWMNNVDDKGIYQLAFFADRIRLLILRDFGGVYVDMDARPIKSFNNVLINVPVNSEFFAGVRMPDGDNNPLPIIDVTVLGSIPNSRVINILCEVYKRHGGAPITGYTIGQYVMMYIGPDVSIFPHEYFYNSTEHPSSIIIHENSETRLRSWDTKNR